MLTKEIIKKEIEALKKGYADLWFIAMDSDDAESMARYDQALVALENLEGNLGLTNTEEQEEL